MYGAEGISQRACLDVRNKFPFLFSRSSLLDRKGTRNAKLTIYLKCMRECESAFHFFSFLVCNTTHENRGRAENCSLKTEEYGYILQP